MCHMGRRGTAWPLALLCETVRVLWAVPQPLARTRDLLTCIGTQGSPGLVPYHIPLPYQEILHTSRARPNSTLSQRAGVGVLASKHLAQVKS